MTSPAGPRTPPEKTARWSATLRTAVPITADTERHAVIGLGTTFALERPLEEVIAAVLHATAHGIYEVRLNAVPVTDALFTPGWTAYEWRLQVQSVDIAQLLAPQNRIDVRLAGGWYRGDLGFEDANANYGDDLAFLGAVAITYRDGTEQLIATSPRWIAATTDTPYANLYHGQRIDARLRRTPGHSLPLRVTGIDRDTLVTQVGPPVRRQESLLPQSVWTSPSGKTLIDFGQNLVGWIRCTLTGPAGTEVVIRHAEVLENDELGTRPLRSARATDTFILSGGSDTFEPTATVHGFRYAEISGWPGPLTTDAEIEAVVVHSQLRRTGHFACSDPDVNRLVANALWSQKGNFLDVPTDCP